ncbi:hypothetical protein, conserved [Babesia bigemina]|uniref:Microprotein domain-containing protein n=1 Tax=Babesia bigemina TaxID=5866 RepID=A0A061D0V4_BABBI|nr:hypothetical protein, conserved [Babesia bigemina]CDR94436.1 hypothetical protein, conserved [Babesia bigemina]|eukprot:XP_012766622.1 hypothetical protein, conserved [Babesia bigemina]
MSNCIKHSLRLIRLLYKTYNHRDIRNVCDFELQYGLLCGEDNILHFACYVCQEIGLLAGTADGAIQSDGSKTASADDIKQLLTELEVLLNELISRRVEERRSYISSICSKQFSNVGLVYGHARGAGPLMRPWCSTPAEELINNEGVFQEYALPDDTVNSIRILSSSLCDEYNERWNLYLVRFDALLKVFLQSKNLKDNDALRTLLLVIHHWRNGGSTRLKKFNIYDVYNARRDVLEVRKAYDGSPPLSLVKLYSEHSAVPPEGQLTSFIKRVQISEPTHRLGIPEGFSTKRFYKKFSRH